MRYAAFISYRHVDPDRKWAKWLHRCLETYRVPSAMVKTQGVSPRIGRVFRDEEELAASADLSQEIKAALEESQYLLIVCSPNALGSRWVNEEIKEFAALGRRNSILALLTSGEPEQSFPPALLDLGIEPLAADVRDGSRHAKQLAELRILAALLGCRFDDLRQREHERRLRRAMLLTGAMALAAILFLVLAIIALIQRDTAKSRELAVSSSYALNDDPELSVLLATEALRVHRTAEAEEALRNALVHFKLRAVLSAGVGGVNRVSFSPDSERLVAAGEDGTVSLWNVENHSAIQVIHAHSKPVNSVAFSPDGRLIVSASGDAYASRRGEDTARIWDASSGAILHELKGHTGYIAAAEFSHDGRFVITAGSDATARVWESATGKAKLVLNGHRDALTGARFARDDKSAFTTSLDWNAMEWDLATGKPKHKYPHVGEVYGLALDRAGKLVGTSEEGYAEVESARDFKQWCEIHGYDDDHDIIGLAFSPDGTMLATAGTEGVALIAAVGTSPPTDGVCESIALQGHNGSVNNVAFTPDGESVITASDDHTARIWEAKTGLLTAQLLGHAGPVRDVEVSLNGRYVATASAEGTVRLWEINLTFPRLTLPGSRGLAAPAGESVLTWTDTSASIRDMSDGHEISKLEHPGNISEAAFSTDGALLLTLSGDGTARIWNAATGALIHRLQSGAVPLTQAAFSRKGDRAAIASSDGMVRVWDVQKGIRIAELRGHTAGVNSAMFSSDGSWVVTASQDGTARVWNAETGNTLLVYRGHSGPVKRATFATNGKRVISVSTGNGDATSRAWNGEPVRIWDSRTGADVFHLAGHTDVIDDAMLSPDGKLVLTISRDTTARTWDPETGINVAELRGNTQQLTTGAFSPDSRFVVTAGGDCSLRVWDARSGNCLLVVPESVGCFERAQIGVDGESVLGQNMQPLAGYPAGNFVDVFTCAVCVDADRLLTLARSRVKRSLSASERARYLH